MRRAFKAPRLIGLFTLALGLTVFSAAMAQAEPGAYWEVGGTKLISPVTLLPEIQAKKDTVHINFLTKSGFNTVEILCTEIKIISGLLHVLGRLTGKIHLEGCITKKNGVEDAACKPKTPGTNLGLIQTEKLEGLLKLHTLSPTVKDDVLQLLPENAKGIYLPLELGATCSFGNKIDVTGTLFLKDGQNRLLSEDLQHLFEEFAPLTKLLFGANPMTMDGSFWAFLEGEHFLKFWKGNPA